jgi:hypothetical protein
LCGIGRKLTEDYIDKKFEQTIYLGAESTAADERFDLKNISAKYENGLLEITLPKCTFEKPEPASRKIDIIQRHHFQFIEFMWINPFLQPQKKRLRK